MPAAILRKNAAISARILALTAGGMDIIDACKQVLGADKVDTMIGQLYDELRTKAV